jgi:hypothetical protein
LNPRRFQFWKGPPGVRAPILIESGNAPGARGSRRDSRFPESSLMMIDDAPESEIAGIAPDSAA